jgi:hypothetical protein
VRWGVLLCTVVAAVAVTTSAASAAASCLSTAKSAVAASKPRITNLAGEKSVVKPSELDTAICWDFTRDGRGDVAASVASGGTAGDVGWVVIVRTPSGWKFGHGDVGYKLGLFKVGNDVVVMNPVYKKNDPNCCPTGGFDHERWHWNGKTFVRVRIWHNKSYKP